MKKRKVDAADKLKEHEAAIRKYQRDIEINPEDAGAYYSWGTSLTELGKYAEAIGKYQRAIEIAPEETNAYCNRGHPLVGPCQAQKASLARKKGFFFVLSFLMITGILD